MVYRVDCKFWGSWEECEFFLTKDDAVKYANSFRFKSYPKTDLRIVKVEEEEVDW